MRGIEGAVRSGGGGLRGKAELIASQPDNTRQETDVQETTAGYSNSSINSPAIGETGTRRADLHSENKASYLRFDFLQSC